MLLRFRPVALAALLGLATLLSAPAARADIIAQATDGTSTLAGTFYVGQAFTTTTGTSETDIAFNFFSDVPATTPTAFGTAYLLSQSYAGTPASLSAAAPGFLGQATASGGFYNFDSSVTLQPLTQYFLYEDSLIPLAGITGNSSYAGSFFFTNSSSSSYASTTSANFRVTGTSTVPEPSPLAAFALGGLGLMGLMAWRRRPSKSSATKVAAGWPSA